MRQSSLSTKGGGGAGIFCVWCFGLCACVCARVCVWLVLFVRRLTRATCVGVGVGGGGGLIESVCAERERETSSDFKCSLSHRSAVRSITEVKVARFGVKRS